MDNTLLHLFEELLTEAQRDAENIDHGGITAGPWGVWPSSVIESFGVVTDMLARSTGMFPANPHYVREKTGALLRAVIELYDKVMMVPVCDHEEPDGVDDSGTIFSWDCERNAGHSGDHESNPPARRLARHAHEVLASATTVSAAMRWALLTDGDTVSCESRQLVAEALGGLRGVVGELGHLLQRLPAA